MQDSMPAYLSPFAIALESDAPSTDLPVIAGALIGNLAMIAVVTAGGYIITRVIAAARGLQRDQSKAQAFVRFPSFIWVPALLYLQPTLLLSMLLVLQSPRSGYKLLGAIGMICGVVGAPVCAYLMHAGSSALIYTEPDATGVVAKLFESGTYTHPNDPRWVQRFGLPIMNLRGNRRWFFLLEVLSSIIMGLAAGLQPSAMTDCLSRTIVLLGVMIVQLAVVVLAKPHAALIETIFYGVALSMQIAAAVIVLIAQIGGNTDDVSSAYDVASSIYAAYASAFIAYALVNCGLLLINLGRRCGEATRRGSARHFGQSDKVDFGDDGSSGDDGSAELEAVLLGSGSPSSGSRDGDRSGSRRASRNRGRGDGGQPKAAEFKFDDDGFLPESVRFGTTTLNASVGNDTTTFSGASVYRPPAGFHNAFDPPALDALLFSPSDAFGASPGEGNATRDAAESRSLHQPTLVVPALYDMGRPTGSLLPPDELDRWV
jgi:hypothetical protein